MMAPEQISFSQVDITDQFGDDLRLGPDEWILTTPLNSGISNPQAQGLPPVGATDEEVYRAAEFLSGIRESIVVPNDGVYCPVCHIANVTLSLLRTPCPKCGRPLLKFGWD
jgi:hypothetical protein